MGSLQNLVYRTEALWAASSTFSEWEFGRKIGNFLGPIITSAVVAGLTTLVENRIKSLQGSGVPLPSLGEFAIRTGTLGLGSYLFGGWMPGRLLVNEIGALPVMGIISFVTLLIEDRFKNTEISLLDSPTPSRRRLR